MMRNGKTVHEKGAAKRGFAAVLTVALLVTLLSSCAQTDTKKELFVPASSASEVGVCERGDLEKLIVKDGHVEGSYEILSFEADGYLFEMFSKAGDKVGKGDVIAALTSADYMEILDLETEIEELKKKYKEQKDYLEASVKLKEKNGENATEERLTFEKEAALMDLKLSQKEKRYEKLKNEDIGYNYITAPSDGYVVAVSSSPEGSFLTTGTPVAAVATDNMKRFISSEFISEKVAEGYDSFYAIINGIEYPLTYVPITKEELANLSAAGKKPKSRFEFVTEPGDDINVGDYAAVITVVEKKEDVLNVPVNSVYTDKDGRFVYIMLDDGRKERREVVTGLSGGARIEVIEGVKEGECLYVEN